MSAVDPIFNSLWESTLSELGAEPGIWEVYSDTPNFYSDASPEVRGAEAEAVLRRLQSERRAEFVRRPWNASAGLAGYVLLDHEVEALIASHVWRIDPPLRNGEIRDELNIWLVPTEKWGRWADTNWS